MSTDPRTQRHQPPNSSRWLLLMKVIIAVGRVVSFVKFLWENLSE